MTPRTSVPSLEDVQLAIKELTEPTGKPPAASTLARHLGIPNTTFRRSFPDIATQLRQQRAANPTPRDGLAPESWFNQLERDNTRLRRENQNLTEHLELAVANIQRLTLENHQLRHELETTTGVHQIGTVTTDQRSTVRPKPGP